MGCSHSWKTGKQHSLTKKEITTEFGFETMHVPVVARHQADTPCQNGHNRARRASSKTHIPMNERQVTPPRENKLKLFLLRARRTKASQRAGTMCLLHFLQGPNCESCNMTSATLSRFQNLREMRRDGMGLPRNVLEKFSPRARFSIRFRSRIVQPTTGAPMTRRTVCNHSCRHQDKQEEFKPSVIWHVFVLPKT